MACKRKLDDFNASEVKESKNAVVHGVITELSPVKKSKKDESVKYFSGKLSDDKDSVRVICFYPSLRNRMSSSFEKKDTVSLVNCQVRASRGGGSEILLTDTSKVEASPKKFDSTVALHCQKEPACVALNDLSSLVMGENVTVTVKVKSVDPPQEVKNREGKALKKQDCVVGDADGCSRVVLWEGDVGKMIEDESYKLIGVTVRSFRGVNYLSVGKDCEIVGVGDIGETAVVEDGDLQEKGIVRKVIEGEIDGVKFADEYDGCMTCNAKVEGEDELLAECTKCGLTMKRKKCRKFVSARVVVEDETGKRHTLMMFNDVIKSIVGDGAVNLKRALLGAGRYKFSIDKGDIVYSVKEC